MEREHSQRREFFRTQLGNRTEKGDLWRIYSLQYVPPTYTAYMCSKGSTSGDVNFSVCGDMYSFEAEASEKY